MGEMDGNMDSLLELIAMVTTGKTVLFDTHVCDTVVLFVFKMDAIEIDTNNFTISHLITI